ncbi:MAG: S8/S53 family peptidase [Solirubrobacterales bacterium]|nr:S8/S53 family peptidase [Solirubrobacterales bacterium]
MAPRLLGPAPAGERIRFTLLMRLPGAAHARALVRAIEDPSSPQFRHFVSPTEYGPRFGISTARLAALERALRGHGLRVVASFPQRTELIVTGTVRTVERLLHVKILTYADRAGNRFHVPRGTPVIPPDLSDGVAVTGLDTRPRWRPNDVPIGGLTPTTSDAAYDVGPLRAAGFDGNGKTIAVISFSSSDPGDPAAWMNHYGVNGPAVRFVSVDGGASRSDGADENNLDIEVIRDIAPAARIMMYELPPTTGAYGDAVNRIVADHQTDIISSSWGEGCEVGLDRAERAATDSALSAAVATGVTTFVASGDSGAYDCQRNNLSDHRLSVDWPAASSNVVAVGGTRLDVAGNGSYLGETGWEDQLSDAGGGGGFSVTDPRPKWQTGPGVLSNLSNGRRQVPDVSADADPSTGWSEYSQGQAGEAGGTSAATPLWAASMLLIEQYASSHGVPRLGFVDPLLYTLARSTQQFPPFHDVTLGGNRHYQAGPGWDPATGLGSPDVFNLARDLVAYLRAHPVR